MGLNVIRKTTFIIGRSLRPEPVVNIGDARTHIQQSILQSGLIVTQTHRTLAMFLPQSISLAVTHMTAHTVRASTRHRHGGQHHGSHSRRQQSFSATPSHDLSLRWFITVSRTCSMSQRGVEVAPQMPTDEAPSIHAGSKSADPDTRYVRGFTSRHSLKSTLPLLLLTPATNSTTP